MCYWQFEIILKSMMKRKYAEKLIAAITKYKSIDYARKYAKTVNEKGIDQIDEIAVHTDTTKKRLVMI